MDLQLCDLIHIVFCLCLTANVISPVSDHLLYITSKVILVVPHGGHVGEYLL